MLTGDDIYHIAMTGLQQDDVHIHNEAFYKFIAARLNASHIAPLQGLVKELVALFEDDELMIEDCPDGWYDRKRKAYDLAQQLLQEDIP